VMCYLSSPVRQCGMKRQYATSHTAKRSARWTMATIGGRALVQYRCPHCGYWHIGHQTARRATGAATVGGNGMSAGYDDNELAAVAAELRAARMEQRLADSNAQAVELELGETLKVAYAAVRVVDNNGDVDCSDEQWDADWQALEDLVAAWRPR